MTHPDQPHVFAAHIQKIWILRCIDIPRDISKALRAAVGENAKHIPVHRWIEGLPYKTTLVPRGGGNYRMHVHSRIWRKPPSTLAPPSKSPCNSIPSLGRPGF